jgi:hypothetical protein
MPAHAGRTVSTDKLPSEPSRSQLGKAAVADDCPTPSPKRRTPDADFPKIAVEQPFGVAERVYWQYEDPDVAMRSYSAVDVNGCSGTMIGPNTMLTASHCGTGNRPATFRLYAYSNTQITEQFDCTRLLHTFSDMDLNVYWCPANADGESPGDKYGYADFDVVVDPDTRDLDVPASQARIANSKQVYSIWMNPIDTLGTGWHSLYSEGVITEAQLADHWGSPNLNVGADYRCGNYCCDTGASCTGNCDGGACGTTCAVGSCKPKSSLSVGVRTDLWSNGGASGSAQFSRDNHRLLIGPLSTGERDRRGRNAVPIVNHLYWGYTSSSLTGPGSCMPCVASQVNTVALADLGLANPAALYGYVDYLSSNEDGLLDVQQELEELVGENARDWYWLGFESLRRNALWDSPFLDAATFDTADAATGIATLDSRAVVQPGYTAMLSHERLDLPESRFYDVSLTTWVDEAVHANPLRLCLEGTSSDCVDFDPPSSAWHTSVARLWASESAALRISLREGTLLQLVAVSVIEHGAIMDFDSHDRRFQWRNHNTGARGLVWPNGVDSATEADWAGVVHRDPNRPLDDDWPLRNRQLAIDGGERYRVCFSYEKAIREPLTFSFGAVRMLNELGVIPGSTFFVDPSDDWRRACTSWFHVPTDDNNLQFGVHAFTTQADGAWLVDDVEVVSESIFSDGFESGDSSRWLATAP